MFNMVSIVNKSHVVIVDDPPGAPCGIFLLFSSLILDPVSDDDFNYIILYIIFILLYYYYEHLNITELITSQTQYK